MKKRNPEEILRTERAIAALTGKVPRAFAVACQREKHVVYAAPNGKMCFLSHPKEDFPKGKKLKDEIERVSKNTALLKHYPKCVQLFMLLKFKNVWLSEPPESDKSEFEYPDTGEIHVYKPIENFGYDPGTETLHYDYIRPKRKLNKIPPEFMELSSSLSYRDILETSRSESGVHLPIQVPRVEKFNLTISPETRYSRLIMHIHNRCKQPSNPETNPYVPQELRSLIRILMVEIKKAKSEISKIQTFNFMKSQILMLLHIARKGVLVVDDHLITSVQYLSNTPYQAPEKGSGPGILLGSIPIAESSISHPSIKPIPLSEQLHYEKGELQKIGSYSVPTNLTEDRIKHLIYYTGLGRMLW